MTIARLLAYLMAFNGNNEDGFDETGMIKSTGCKELNTQ